MITGSTQTVFSGQLVALSITTPAGYSLASQTWSISNSSDAIGGYTASAASGHVDAINAFDQNTINFYFVNVNQTSETVTSHYVLQSGDPTGIDATLTFNVQGPTGVTVDSAIGYVGLFQSATGTNFLQLRGLTNLCGIPQTASGASFTADESAAVHPPAGYGSLWGNVGSYSWIQLLKNSNTQKIIPTGI